MTESDRRQLMDGLSTFELREELQRRKNGAMFGSPDARNRLLDTAANILNKTFHWHKTKEGEAYWNAVHSALLRILKEGR